MRFTLAAALTIALAVPAQAQSTPSAETIVQIETLERGMPATISGEIVRRTDEDEAILRDASGTVRLYFGGPFFEAMPGDRVTVRGWMDDDLIGNEFYVNRVILADGTIVETARGYR